MGGCRTKYSMRGAASFSLQRSGKPPAPRCTRGADSRNTAPPMSGLGQKQTLGHVRIVSALPPKADIETQSRDVRFVPKADILHCNRKSRLDHLVGAGKYLCR